MKRLRRVLTICLMALTCALGLRVGWMLGLREAVRFPAVKVNEAGARLDVLLRSIAASTWHGSRDDGKSVRELAGLARTRKLTLTCGYVSAYAQAQLVAAGFKARIADTLTLDAWDCCNNGHTLLEVWHPFYNSWVVVDLDFNRMYAETLLEFAAARTTPILLADDAILDPAEFPGQGDPDVEADDEYPRVVQAVGIVEGGATVFACSPNNAARVESYAPSYACITRATFVERFYEGS